MKYLRLVWANLTRKKVRTTLTIGSFVVALFLYGLLVTIRAAFSGGPKRPPPIASTSSTRPR